MPDESEILFLEKQLCFPLYAASRLTTKIYGPYLEELDLTYPQYLVMLVLWEKGKQTVSEISHLLHLETNTVTPLLKRLEQKHLLDRKRSETDERSVLVSLTDKGTVLREKAVTIPEKMLNSFSDSTISMSELQVFQKTLFKLVDVLSEKVKGKKS
ncbi:MarR family transcriptional regulator [Limibacter armeniacum]|uniref:MarR family winged helix-turn-helix transcriptional regulator n=1 Tax=Limibacter armeniacum TaxID=466084 RepID=UPI002FE60A63